MWDEVSRLCEHHSFLLLWKRLIKASWESYRFSQVMGVWSQDEPCVHTLTHASKFSILLCCMQNQLIPQFFQQIDGNAVDRDRMESVEAHGGSHCASQTCIKQEYLFSEEEVSARYWKHPLLALQVSCWALSPFKQASPENRLCQEYALEIVSEQKNQCENLKLCQSVMMG